MNNTQHFSPCIMFSRKNFAQLKFCTHLTLVPNFIRESPPPPSSALISCLLYFTQNWLSYVSKQFWEKSSPLIINAIVQTKRNKWKGSRSGLGTDICVSGSSEHTLMMTFPGDRNVLCCFS